MYRGCGVGTISAVAPLRVAPAAPHQPALTAAPPARGALVVMAHFVYAGRVGGAEHMLYNLLHGFAAAATPLQVVCAARGNLDPGVVAELERMPGTRVLEVGGGGPRFLAEQRACLHDGLRGEAVLFPNYFVPPLVPRRLGRVAVVLHDLQYRHFPAHFTARKRAWLALSQALAVRRAERVIAISQFVADDAVRCFGRGLAGKLAVVPNPISWQRFAAGAARPRPLDRRYVLTVAAQYPHKNLETLLRAFALVAARDPEPMLVLCGQDYGGLRGVAAGRGGLRPLLDALGLADRVVLTGYLDDAALGRWYRHAALFAFPSVFEGFGMPAVEALGFGLPVLTTRRTALPEATLGLACYIDDPYRVEEWAAQMATILRDPAAARPDADAVARIREHYDIDRIAGCYLEACGV